jgi:hypothetical protein
MKKLWENGYFRLMVALLMVLVVGKLISAAWGAASAADDRADQKRLVPVTAFLSGTHDLRRMVQSESQESHLSGGGFFLFGVGGMGVDGESHTDIVITFAWRANDGSYIITRAPITKIRVKLVDNLTVPSVEFHDDCDESTMDCMIRFGHNNIQSLFDNDVEYVTVHCRPEDWPTKLTMPLS